MAIILGALVKRTNSKDAAVDDRRDRLEAERKDKQEKLARLYRAIEVGKEKIRIIGDTNVLAGAVSVRKDSLHNVRGYVRNWRTQEDSNLWPLPSEQVQTQYASVIRSIPKLR